MTHKVDVEILICAHFLQSFHRKFDIQAMPGNRSIRRKCAPQHNVLFHWHTQNQSICHSYVTDMLHRQPLHTHTSSYTMPLLNRPAHSKATLGDRSFSFASSSV